MKKNCHFIAAVAIFALFTLIPLPSSAQSAATTSRMTRTEEPPLPPLVPFGYDIFRPDAEQITEGPVDDLYVLSPGDEIIITIWGQLNQRYPLTITDEGFIDIPDDGGRVYTNGVTLRELKRLVTESLARINATYINPQNPAQSTAFVDVKLATARKILVYVVGEVKNQGPYTISSGVATLLNLLNNAGGVKETGSLRDIRIRRAGSASGTLDTVDLYDFLLTGKIDAKKTQIRYGDYIIVPLKAKSVSVRGEVKRPGIYEVIGNEGLKGLIPFAGGLSSNAYLKRVQIKRFEMNAGEKYYDVDLESLLASPSKDFPLSDKDEIRFFPNITVRQPVVDIRGGGVKRPGRYQFAPGMTVKDLVAMAEGLKEGVFLGRADLVRTSDDLTKRLTIFTLQDLFKEEAPGQYAFIGPPDKNFPLKELDSITTYSSFEMKGKDKEVTIEGQVKEPGTYILAENTTLYDLIFSRGGFQDEDFRKKTFLELAHVFRKIPGEVGEKVIPFNLGKLLDGDPAANFRLEGNDRIVTYSFETVAERQYVTIEGLIYNPRTYPYAENLTLEDLIIMAGGLRPDAYKVEAVIGRTGSKSDIASETSSQKTTATTVVPVRIDYALLAAEQKTKLEPYDKITVRNVPGWEPQPVATIWGQVVYPGNYTLKSQDEPISSLVKRAGGLRDEALPEGAVLYRRKDIVEMTPESQMESQKVAINLKQAMDDPGGVYDLVLKDNDRIFVPYNPGTVEVKGAVRNPAIFQYKKGKGLSYYLKLSGSYGNDAAKGGLIVLGPNGMVSSKSFLSGPEILPGTVIDVPFKADEKEIELIEIRGAVKNPILVQFRKGEKLDYYIGLGGGYREDADLENIVIHLKEGNSIESRGAGLFNPLVTEGSVIEVPFKVKEKTIEEEGVPAPALTGPETKALIGDIEVRGAVWNPGLIRYKKDAKFDYYVRFCGGFKDNADSNNVVVNMPDGKVVERKGAREFIPALVPGCIIEVPFMELKKEEKKID